MPMLNLSKLFRHPPAPIESDHVPENPDSDPGTPYPPTTNPDP